MRRAILRIAISALLCGGGWTCIARAQQSQRSTKPVEALQIQPGFYMLTGAGGNIAVQIGPDGVVLVDAGSAEKADDVLVAIKKLTDRPIRYIINTSPDADHVGGNEKIAQAGQSLFPAAQGGGGGPAIAINNGGSASIVGTENLLTRMSAPTGKTSPFPTVAWPTETFTRNQKNLYLNREGIAVMAEPAAHTDSDSVVFFRRSDVIVTGDILDITRFPVIDLEKGGSIQGEIDALNRLVDLAIPSIPLPFQEGGTQIVPGHGRVCEQAEVVEYRDMVTIIRDVIADMIAKGMTLEQIKAASPTRGYTRRYGSESGTWTTNMFVEAVYRSLTVRK